MPRILQIYKIAGHFKDFCFGRDIYREERARFKNKFGSRPMTVNSVGWVTILSKGVFNPVDIHQKVLKQFIRNTKFLFPLG